MSALGNGRHFEIKVTCGILKVNIYYKSLSEEENFSNKEKH